MKGHYHFIGIGGIGMSAIAKLYLRRGIKISGSDLKESKITEELKNLGADVFIGHAAINVNNADLVVYSSAIKEDNPEFQEAQKLKVPLLKRAEALSRLMQNKKVITVAGSHGKTTTTSLISYMLFEAGLLPTVAIGGILKNIDSNASLGEGDFFVAEADESDGSFLYYQPNHSVITNIDYEHLDYYKEFKNAVSAFREFINKTIKNGCVFACCDDKNLKSLFKDYRNRYILFGLGPDADISAKNIKINGLSSEFDCFYRNKLVDRFTLMLGGKHNISNALSVIALGLELKIDLEVIKKALLNYKGAGRRLEIKFDNQDYLIIDDYAHHPTEIQATLEAVKSLEKKKIIAVFQPHRYSRTGLLWEEFARSFNLADEVIVTDIYSAGETPVQGITADRLSNRIRENNPRKPVTFLPKQEITDYILRSIQPGDLVITLGAGDITKISDEMVSRFKR
ncbi:MAG: UDP-N-acetylmuramate--L-alanine ligase [Omnitrophica WOR_2 bacterium RBG_13_41_10]|nr:MAG: UDP-N-acetylmuramate--L-alanine ligase [Omnitrophica WOR_2 bacterium RBG_13_41_10]